MKANDFLSSVAFTGGRVLQHFPGESDEKYVNQTHQSYLNTGNTDNTSKQDTEFHITDMSLTTRTDKKGVI